MPLRIVGVMNVYNEQDILAEILGYYESEGLDFIVVDNGSTDGSYEIAEKFLGRNVVRLERVRSEHFSLRSLIERDLELVDEFGAGWVLWADADEFMESPYAGRGFVEAVEEEAGKGYNVIQFNNFRFFSNGEGSHVGERPREDAVLQLGVGSPLQLLEIVSTVKIRRAHARVSGRRRNEDFAREVHSAALSHKIAGAWCSEGVSGTIGAVRSRREA